MKIKHLLAVIGYSAVSALVSFGSTDKPIAQDVKSSFQVSVDTESPDGLLNPGEYSIRLADHLADRVLVEIRSSADNAKKTFLGVPAKNLAASLPAGPVTSTGTESKVALRGFSFPNGQVIEFVYPKNDAVGIAKTSGETVLAIDPESEGMPSTPGLSAADRRLITLWMLTPSPVTADNPKGGIQAARYQAPKAKNTLRAEAKPPVLPKLPKTGSMIPLLWLVGVGSFGFALALTARRLRLRSN
jgi:hypothetical protein